MNKFFAILLVAITTVGFGSCQREAATASSTKSLGSSCACNDMACWQKDTNSAVKDQLSCAASAMGSAADLASGGSVAAVRVLTAISVLASIGSVTLDVAVAGSQAPTVIAGLEALILGERRTLKSIFGTDTFDTPQFACFQNGVMSGVDIAAIYHELTAVSEGASSTGLSPYIKVMNSVTTNALRIHTVLSTFKSCTESLQAINPAFAKSLEGFLTGFEGVLAPVMAASALLNCGMNITNGVIVLGQNTQCLAADFDNLVKSRDQLNSSFDKYQNTAAPNGTANGCNAEPVQCNTYGMNKFGAWLRSQSTGWFESRASFCASMCGNVGRGQTTCTDNAAAIFTADDAPVCKTVCATAQCGNAIDSCLGFCCQQESSCADAAHKLLGN